MTRVGRGHAVIRSRRALVVVALAAGLVHAEVSPSAPTSRVRSIQFFTSGRIDRADYRRELPLQVGGTLSQEKLDASVEWLRRKRIFEAVTVDATPSDEGVDVVFHLEPMPFVVGVQAIVETSPGELPPVDEEAVLRRARIREDESLSAAGIAAARSRIADLLGSRGYPKATIAVETVRVRPGQVRAVIRVRPGQPMTIVGVEIDGLDPAWGEEVRSVFPLQVGSPAAESDLGAGRTALLAALRKRGFYEAEVAATQDSTGGRVALHYEVHLGPRFHIEVGGNHAFSSQDLLDLIDLTARPIITRGTWRLMGERIQEYYHEQGYPSATVDVEIAGADPRRVRFEVEEGPQVRVREMTFSGNHAISAHDLLSVMQTRPRASWSLFGFFGNSSDLFREEVFSADLEQIRDRYHRIGYLEAAVQEAERRFSDDRAWITLRVEIAEGRQSRIGTAGVEGVDGILTNPTRGLSLQPGAPFHPDLLQEDRRRLTERLGALGYVDAKITAAAGAPVSQDGTETIDVRFGVEPGAQVRIGDVIIENNYYTLDHVVRRSLPFTSGDPLDPEKLSAGQAALYRTGLFRSVAIHPIQDRGRIRDVAVEVGERPGGEFQYGFGYDTRVGLRNFLQIAHRNLWGTGDQLSLRGDLNLAPGNLLPDEYILSLDGKVPHFRDGAYDLLGNVLGQQSERDIDEFSIRRFSVSSGFEREFLPGLRGTIVGQFEYSDVFDVAPDAVLTSQDEGRLRTVTLNPIVVYDGRDDAFAPTRGVFESLRLRYGSPPFGSQVHFWKGVLQHSHYVPLRAGLTWLYGARLGYAQPLGFTSTIPITERFFLGGRTTVRGYDENSIGPKGDDGNPTGGDILVNLKSEVHFPLFFGLRGAVFWDGGALYLHDHAISMHDFRQGVGPGLRYQTPIGAISLDYGFKIRRRPDESIGEVNFSIGNIF